MHLEIHIGEYKPEKQIPESVVYRMVTMATREAMRGNPLKEIKWVPPPTAASDPKGVFVVEAHKPWESGSFPPPWEPQ